MKAQNSKSRLVLAFCLYASTKAKNKKRKKKRETELGWVVKKTADVDKRKQRKDAHTETQVVCKSRQTLQLNFLEPLLSIL